MKDHGYYIEYTNKSGIKQRAMVYYAEQKQSFRNTKKVFCHLVNDDLEFKTDENGKKIVSIVEYDKCLVIGYFD